MKKPFKGKLSLDRETLTVLAGEALDRVGGGNAGATQKCTMISCPIGCGTDPQTIVRC